MYNKSSFIEALFSELPDSQIAIDEPLNLHTTFKIGGPADVYIKPDSAANLKKALDLIKAYNVPLFVIGNGSNLLAKDEGFPGAVIQVYKNMSNVLVEGLEVVADAGVSLAKLSGIIAESSLEGFEFASGIPGTLGGAVFMNAGAYGGEMKDILVSIEVMDREGQMFSVDAKDLELGYRTSILQNNDWIVLSAKMQFGVGKPSDIKALMKDLNNRRKEKQPLDLPSAGSAFKRPVGYYAGKLIMDAGLRGYRIGDAAVSEKHCGFIVNLGEATSADILALVEHVEDEVYSQFQVKLETELRMIEV